MVYTEYRFYGKYFCDLLSDVVCNRCKYVDYVIYYVDMYIQNSHLNRYIYSHIYGIVSNNNTATSQR